jgi:hypothetical protein
VKTLTAADLHEAQAGSFYTIAGTGGPLHEYIEAVENFLAAEEVGKPQEWFTTKGHEVNEYARLTKRGEILANDKFPSDLTFLLFPLDMLDVDRLAIIKLRMGDRWFDDIVENMRVVRP